MSKFLDETGLSYFWNKIKAALANVAFSGSYNDLLNKPTIPPSIVVDSALSSTSTNPVQNKVINTALGTKANDSDVVHITGNETIDGHKDFKQSIRFCSDIAFVNQSFVKGTAPSSAKNTAIYFADKIENLTPGVSIPAEHRTAIIRQFYGTAGNNALQFFVYYPSSANNSYFYLTLNTNADGSSLYFAPSISEICSLGLTNNRWSTVYTQYVDATQYQGTQAALNLSTTFTSAKEYWPFIITRNPADTTNSSGNLMQLGVQQGTNTQTFRIQLRVANPRGGNLPTDTTSGAATGNCWGSIGVLYDYDLNRTYPECLNCTSWGVSDNSTSHLASTAWVRTATGNTALNAATATDLASGSVLSIAKGGTGESTRADAQSSLLTGIAHTSGSYDFNDFTSSSINTFSSSTTLTNCPNGTNGLLLVFATSGIKKQFWSRYGTFNSNDHYLGFRTGNDTSWSNWHKVYTDSDTIPVANGGTGLTSLDTFVRTTGNQSIAGVKTFTDTLIIEEATPNIYIRDTNFAKGDTITSTQYNYISFGGSDTTDSNPKRLGVVGLVVSANDTRMNLFAFQNVANSSNGDGLRIIYPNTGSCYATAPTTPTGATGTEIITADFFNSNVVKLSGDQSIAGAKTFTSSPLTEKSGTPIIVLERTSASSYSDVRFNVNGAAATAFRLTASNNFQIGTKGSASTWYDGCSLFLNNNNTFQLRSGYGSSKYDLLGSATGDLTWDGKGFVYTSGDQTIDGRKIFTGPTITSYKNSETNTWVGLNSAVTKGQTTTAIVGSITFGGNAADISSTSLAESALVRMRCYLGTVDSSVKNCLGVCIYNNTANSTSFGEFVFSRTEFFPSADNGYNLGISGHRWKQLYAGTTTISTSDERLKDNISAVPDAVLDAWGDVQWGQFQFRDSIAEKGADKARLHNGLVAQRIDAAFKAHGQDASRYGLFCYDEWDATPEEKDEQGNVCEEAKPAGNIYSLRYEEALCLEAAYQRRRADRAEARITALEQRLNELEEVLMTLGDHSNAS